MAEIIKTTFQFKRGKAATWQTKNLVLAAGEPGFEVDTYRLKIGDGQTNWNDLQYFGGSGILRRDNEYNYDSDYIPQKGEVLLVDTASEGLKIKIGDGTTAFSALPYQGESSSSALVYAKDGKIYSDNAYTQEITPIIGKIYVDQTTRSIYTTDGTDLLKLNESLPTATAEIKGIVKLYSETGTNTDGTMTQKAITDALNLKVSASISEETLILE